MRRAPVLALLAASALLAGCTDPSPTDSTAEPSTTPPAASDETTEASTEASDSATAATAPEAPVFGIGDAGAGAGTACLNDAVGSPVSFITVLTAGDAITIDEVAIVPADPSYEVEVLDAFVLPYAGGPGGLTIDDYPPDDPDGAREDAVGYQLAAAETVTIGVGVVSEEPDAVWLSMAVRYHATDGAADDAQTVTAPYQIAIAERCEG